MRTAIHIPLVSSPCSQSYLESVQLHLRLCFLIVPFLFSYPLSKGSFVDQSWALVGRLLKVIRSIFFSGAGPIVRNGLGLLSLLVSLFSLVILVKGSWSWVSLVVILSCVRL